MGDKDAAEFEAVVNETIVNAKGDDWQKVGDVGDTWEFQTQPSITGLYIAKRDHIGENDSTMYSLELTDKPGTIIGVWSTAVLANKMSQVPIGHEVRIDYKGKAKSEKGGREYHDFEVYHRAPAMRQV